MLVVCPHCNAANRVPSDRAGDDPVCGKCGAAILDGTPVALDESRFDRFVARSELPVVVDFWASWCGPCKRSFPWMGEMQKKYGDGGLTVVAINVDKKREDAAKFLAATPGAFTIVYDPAGSVASSYDVKGMPTSYLVDRAGRVVAVDSGFRDDAKAAWEARIKSALETR